MSSTITKNLMYLKHHFEMLLFIINALELFFKCRQELKFKNNQDNNSNKCNSLKPSLLWTKQVLRSTILSSTIVLVFFDNARIGRF